MQQPSNAVNPQKSDGNDLAFPLDFARVQTLLAQTGNRLSPQDERNAASIGECVRQIRANLRLSRGDLARQIAVTIEEIVAVENGCSNVPNSQKLLLKASELLANRP